MTTYNVHIYREMRLVFGGIEADSPEAAAAIARDKLTSDADSIDDCDGETFAALVDVQDDEEYAQSRVIDFEPERLRKAAPKLLMAVVMAENYLADDLDEDDETEMRILNAICNARAEANAASIRAESPASGPEQPVRFEIEHDPAENSDRVYVMVDGKFDVAIIRTDEGVVVDVYPKDGFETIATTYAFDSDVEQESSTN